ncbi:MAG: hypothetical protein EOM10_16905, partial [Opitutae bacterium]|nr:hypothetical protein [Opitutae bacterium]
ISIGDRTLTTQTQRSETGGLPFFAALLSDNLGDSNALRAEPGDTVTITATADGQSKSVSFIAQEGGQQVDVVLPRVAFESNWARGERPTPNFKAAAMAYDATHKRIILFGGLERQGSVDVPLAETWAWDGRSWMRLAPMVVPPARSGHTMAYDVARQRIILFGGTGSGGVALTDTWEWDGTIWRESVIPTPPALSGRAAMAYDSARNRVLLVGADAANPTDFGVWAWDGATWMRQPATILAPARTGFDLAYDAERDRLVLFGGLRASVLQQDIWEYNGATWARAYPLTMPSARSGHAMSYDPVRGQVLLVGGVDAGGKPLEDSWAWDGKTWTELRIDLPPRARALLTYDSTRQVPVLAGGYSDAAATTYPG